MSIVTTREQNESLPLRSCIRRWRLFAWTFWVGVVVLWLLRTFVAQDHLLVAPLTYLPQILVGPALLLTGISGWWWGRRLMVLCIATGIGYHASLFGGSWKEKDVDSSAPLRVVFVNRGDQDTVKWKDWIVKQGPDLIGLTDLRGRDGSELSVGGPTIGGLPYLMRIGEHALASRYPFKGTQVVKSDVPAAGPVRVQYLPAARFEVDVPGGPVAVYVVHVRSPRDALSKYGSLKIWKWTLLGVPAHVSSSVSIGYYWDEQKLVVEGLLKRIEAETMPTIVLGDWNLPDFGPRYRRLTKQLQDAHRVAGEGLGYTFPGDLSSWSALGRPWMRIDYVLADREHWEIHDCQVQSGKDAARSQHRALKVTMERIKQDQSYHHSLMKKR